MRQPQELNPGILEDRMNFRSWTPKWLLPFAACGANRLAPSGLLVLPLARANLRWTPGGAGPLWHSGAQGITADTLRMLQEPEIRDHCSPQLPGNVRGPRLLGAESCAPAGTRTQPQALAPAPGTFPLLWMLICKTLV